MARFLGIYVRIAFFATAFFAFACWPLAMFVGAMATDPGTPEARRIGALIMLSPILAGACLLVAAIYVSIRPRWNTPAAVVITALWSSLAVYFGPGEVLRFIVGIFGMFR
jgi:hypothetical protein